MKRSGLDMTSIFRCMMEEGYYPTYEKTHILFGLDDSLGVVEYEEGILSLRLFYTIEEEAYDMFMEASNETMAECYIVKPVLLDDRKSLMFSCEMMCDTVKEFRKFFPRGIELVRDALDTHKQKMKMLMLSENTIPVNDDFQSLTGTSKSHKIFS